MVDDKELKFLPNLFRLFNVLLIKELKLLKQFKRNNIVKLYSQLAQN